MEDWIKTYKRKPQQKPAFRSPGERSLRGGASGRTTPLRGEAGLVRGLPQFACVAEQIKTGLIVPDVGQGHNYNVIVYIGKHFEGAKDNMKMHHLHYFVVSLVVCWIPVPLSSTRVHARASSLGTFGLLTPRQDPGYLCHFSALKIERRGASAEPHWHQPPAVWERSL